jgi:chromosome segregation protein
MQSERLTEKREQLSLNLEEGEAPLEELRLKLEELLDKRMTVDEELKTAQIALEDADRELREAEKRRTQAEQQSQLIRGQLEQQRMEWQALTVRRKALQDQLLEDGYDLHGVLATLTPKPARRTPKKNSNALPRGFSAWARSTSRPSTNTSNNPSVNVIWMRRTPIWSKRWTPWKT